MIENSKVVAFDLDGTLLDSAPDITEALNYVLIHNNLKKVSIKDVKNLIGSGAKALINDSFSKQGAYAKNLDELTNLFLDKYKKCFKERTRLFPHTKTLLKNLKKKNYEIILVSNKPEYYSKELLGHFKISKYFSYISGGDTFKYKKPDSRHLKLAINKAGITNCDCIFIGDSKFDLQCANNSKIPCILLTHGYSNIDIKKLGAFKIIDCLSHVSDIVDKYFQSRY